MVVAASCLFSFLPSSFVIPGDRNFENEDEERKGPGGDPSPQFFSALKKSKCID